MTTRRTFLAALLAAGAAPSLGWAAVGNPSWLAAVRGPDGSFGLYGLHSDGSVAFHVPLPARGHAGAGHPTRAVAVAFARRPGQFALVIDCATDDVRHRLVPPEGRQFNGHGVFAEGGALLLTSEQRADTSAGVIGLWDVDAGCRRIGERSSGGIGPHDLRLMPDGETVVVANGGIATDPADRTKLSIATMRPNLSYLDSGGRIIDQVELASELLKNSIRHLAIRADGLVGFAMQWEGVAMPLLGLHRLGATTVLPEAPLGDELAMLGYAGSIAFSGKGTEIAITSPRGGRLHRFSDAGRFICAVSRTDVCGIAPRGEGFVASDGHGGLIAFGLGTTTPLARFDCAWDNHIVTL
jgi:hypothetical protein